MQYDVLIKYCSKELWCIFSDLDIGLEQFENENPALESLSRKNGKKLLSLSTV